MGVAAQKVNQNLPNLGNIADRLIEDASTALPKLQYGFINTGTESALLTFSSIHASISNPESITINRELDLRILDANREGSRVLGIWTIPDSQFQVNFEKAVNLETRVWQIPANKKLSTL